jgi:hypothetical protein
VFGSSPRQMVRAFCGTEVGVVTTMGVGEAPGNRVGLGAGAQPPRSRAAKNPKALVMKVVLWAAKKAATPWKSRADLGMKPVLGVNDGV